MSDHSAEAAYHPSTGLIRDGLNRSQFRETSEALYLNSGFVYSCAEDAEAAFKGELETYIYSRYGNPTVSVFEERLAAYEGAEMCRATATGMAAVFSALACHLNKGDRLVASNALFGSCHFIVSQIMPRYGVETVFVEGGDEAAWAEALSVPTKAVFIESPSNPMLQVLDIAMIADLTHKAGARLVVDNVFATPMYQKPLALGADTVVYSATKHIDGQGRCLGGAVLADKAFMEEFYIPFYRHTGPSMSPFNAWVMAKSLETMELRVERQSSTAMALATYFESDERVKAVSYPGLASHPQHALARRQMSGFGNILTLELPGGKEAAFRFLNTLSMIDISNNLGDTKTLSCHPATTTHSKLSPEERTALGISDGVLRFSIGLEHVEDLKRDMMTALAAA